MQHYIEFIAGIISSLLVIVSGATIIYKWLIKPMNKVKDISNKMDTIDKRLITLEEKNTKNESTNKIALASLYVILSVLKDTVKDDSKSKMIDDALHNFVDYNINRD